MSTKIELNIKKVGIGSFKAIFEASLVSAVASLLQYNFNIVEILGVFTASFSWTKKHDESLLESVIKQCRKEYHESIKEAFKDLAQNKHFKKLKHLFYKKKF